MAGGSGWPGWPVSLIQRAKPALNTAILAAADNPSSGTLTRQWLGWEPARPGLIADLDDGHYFA